MPDVTVKITPRIVRWRLNVPATDERRTTVEYAVNTLAFLLWPGGTCTGDELAEFAEAYCEPSDRLKAVCSALRTHEKRGGKTLISP